jgi:hypothetical protein
MTSGCGSCATLPTAARVVPTAEAMDVTPSAVSQQLTRSSRKAESVAAGLGRRDARTRDA